MKNTKMYSTNAKVD